MRIEKIPSPLHHAAMDEHIADALFERATDLAYQAFGEATTDDHVEAVYARLVENWLWGAGAAGAVTVH